MTLLWEAIHATCGLTVAQCKAFQCDESITVAICVCCSLAVTIVVLWYLVVLDCVPSPVYLAHCRLLVKGPDSQLVL